MKLDLGEVRDEPRGVKKEMSGMKEAASQLSRSQ